ncbi:hypothetical protein [Parendozoicomonas haliclonae]|uniref:Uncharacterized protein n=1 Tax=Parendozoicomonas haliclonae TaxID=1960125 RepID=A0A1X7AQW2_9GAMM|nr:hypothetical protein [Parendozoicomonas haliclonae]SMA49797.1 hypothetical protein EHSB41UT_03586 [Parendozoicomonas haliclonae]
MAITRKTSLNLVLFLLMLLLSLQASHAQAELSPSEQPPSGPTQWINKARAGMKLPLMRENKQLNRIARHHTRYLKAYQVDWPVSKANLEIDRSLPGQPQPNFRLLPKLDDRILHFRYPSLWVFESYHPTRVETLDDPDAHRRMFTDMSYVQRYFALHPYLDEIGVSYQAYTSTQGTNIAVSILSFGQSLVREVCENLQADAYAPMRLRPELDQWCLGTRALLTLDDVMKIRKHLAEELPDLSVYPYDGQSHVPIKSSMAPSALGEQQTGPAVTIHINEDKWPDMKIRKVWLWKMTQQEPVPIKIKELRNAPQMKTGDGSDYYVYYPVQASEHDPGYLASEGPLEYGQRYTIELVYRIEGIDYQKTLEFQTEPDPELISTEEQISDEDNAMPMKRPEASNTGCDVLWTRSIDENGEEVLYYHCR